MVTTPTTYYAANVLYNCGIQVTGSHNPKHHNGFKMVHRRAIPYAGEIQALRRAIEAGDAHRRDGGSVRQARSRTTTSRASCRRQAGAPAEDRGRLRQRRRPGHRRRSCSARSAAR